MSAKRSSEISATYIGIEEAEDDNICPARAIFAFFSVTPRKLVDCPNRVIKS